MPATTVVPDAVWSASAFVITSAKSCPGRSNPPVSASVVSVSAVTVTSSARTSPAGR
ncbi:hypothetical protein ACVDFE_21080 [Lentzea chajnantorensis]